MNITHQFDFVLSRLKMYYSNLLFFSYKINVETGMPNSAGPVEMNGVL